MLEEEERNLANEIISLINNEDFQFSDLMIEENEDIVAKTPLGWVVVDAIAPASREIIQNLYFELNNGWEHIFKSGKAINRAWLLSDWRLRINGYQASCGEKYMASVRRILKKPLTLREIGLENLALMISNTRGIVLVSGRTSSGKSTTLAAMLDHINSTKKAHILTIEDPIEYVFSRKHSVFSQRAIGHDVSSFAEGVRDGMRQCPDVIMIGEIRDKETAEQALLAGESGTLVIASLHANTPAGAIQKILSFFTADEREAKKESLAQSLLGVVSQNLLSSIDGKNWVLAAEILFNHKQQVADKIGNAKQITSYLEGPKTNDGALSQTMVESLTALVKAGKIAKKDALLAVTGLAQEKLKDQLQSVKE